MVFSHVETVFLTSARNILVGKRHELAQNFDAKLPEILTQNRPKYLKLPKILPEISTPYTNRGGQCPHLLRLCTLFSIKVKNKVRLKVREILRTAGLNSNFKGS